MLLSHIFGVVAPIVVQLLAIVDVNIETRLQYALKTNEGFLD